MKIVLKLTFLCFIAFSCSMNSVLRKSFAGKESGVLEKNFGKPTTIIPRSADSLFVFEKKNDLKSAEISKGTLTLDPMVSPKSTKVERFVFTIRKGKIVDSAYERFYEK